jgi:uncharacterized 2Fe-2S/4Fe-4S cluster protein (DUF4445 family)
MASLTVTFNPFGLNVKVCQQKDILEIAIEAGVSLRAECGGNGICGKCRIIIHNKNATNAITDAERKHLSRHDLLSGYRLACQTIPKRDINVVIPKETMLEERRILVHGVAKKTTLDPAARKLHVKLNEPSLSDVTPDLQRLQQTLADSFKLPALPIDYNLLKELPDILRKAAWDVTVTVWDDERIIDVQPGDTTHELYGFALDIGTSKIVGHMVDLITGKTVGIGRTENPQLSYGADIITRIAFAVKSEANRKTLKKVVMDGINDVLAQACAEAGIDSKQIYEAVLVGNTVMHHLCLGIQSKFTGLSPYVPAVKSLLSMSTTELGIEANPHSIATFLPVIAGFVGADALADVIATDFHKLEKTSILVDIGTNTEVFVGNFKDMVTCSCASGPAFEGARIKHGMKAEMGAIESLQIEPDFEVEFATIGNVRPKGLCGSAMIDLVAEMFKSRILDSKGRFISDESNSRLRRVDQQKEFVVAWADETSTEKDIVITQKDIGEIQLAKAAVFTGCSLLMKTQNIVRRDLDHIFLAGTFGSYINPESAKIVGLIPDVPTERIEFVGNTAIMGAKMALVSKKAMKTAEKLSWKIRYRELATMPEFSRELIDAIFIPHKDLKRFPSVAKYIDKVSST